MNYYNNFDGGFGTGAVAQGNTTIIGGALFFDGEGDGLIINEPLLNAGTGDFSLGFKFKAVSPQDPWSVLLGRGGLSDFVMEVANYGSGQVNVAGGQVYKIDSSAVMSDGQWHKIEVGRNGSNFFVKVDENTYIEAALKSIEALNFSGLILGRAQWSSALDNNFRGYIDDFTFYRNYKPTGTVSIIGTLKQDQVLSVANTLSDGDGLGTITYTWKAGGVTIGTGATYALQQAEVGKTITVTASYTDGGNTGETVTSAATAQVANVNDLPSGAVQFGGNAYRPLSIADIIDPTTQKFNESNGHIYEYINANSITWLGAKAAAESRAMGGFKGYLATITNAAEQSFVISNNPSLVGRWLGASDAEVEGQWKWMAGPEVGTLLGSYSNWANGEPNNSFNEDYLHFWNTTGLWNDAPNTGIVSGSNPSGELGGYVVEYSSDLNRPSFQEGETLYAITDQLMDADGIGDLSYRWQISSDQYNWSNIVGATGRQYTLDDTDSLQYIRFAIDYIDMKSTAETVYSSSSPLIVNVNDSPTGSVIVVGTAIQGQMLTASSTLADADGLGAVIYTWLAGGVTVGTGNTYTLTQAEVGKTITVTASYTDGGNTAEAVTSAATGAVANVNDVPAGSVTISGAPAQGETLSASNTMSDADGVGAITYTWKAGGATVGNGATYTLTQAEVGKTITVMASYTDGGNTAESVTSAATTAVANVNDAPTGTVVITGTATQGQTLTASSTLADADGLGAITFTWRAGGTTVGTGATYALQQAEVGKTITVTASYTDGGSTVESVDSAPSGTVLPLPITSGLRGLAYHWKSHALLDKVAVQIIDQDAVAETPAQRFDLRLASFDPAAGRLSVDLWANPTAVAESLDFTATGPAGATLSFTSSLGADWTALTNATPGQLTLGAYLSNLSATGLAVPTRIGTLQVQVAAGTSDVQVGFSEVRVGEVALADLGLALAGTVTGAGGAYRFQTLPSGSYGLGVSRAAGDGSNGVTSADALAALRLAVGINPNPDPDGAAGPQQALKVSPYQFMAADANQDGKVSSADALAILRMAVKLPTAVAQEWLFVEETRDLWNEAAGQSALTRTNAAWSRAIETQAPGEVNLVGVLKGDVNGSWTAPAGAKDLDELQPGYFVDLSQRIGAPLDQFGVYSIGG